MSAPIKFRIKKEFKIVNRCILCGKIIKDGFLCDSCKKKKIRFI